jgi:hypothetical protein
MFRAIWRILNYHPGPGPTPPRPGASQQQQEKFNAARKEYYNTYTSSDAWKDKTVRIHKRDHYTCQRCGARRGLDVKWLEVHHFTYKNFGYEDDKDLGLYCKPCHEIEDEIRKNKNRRRR